MKTFLALGVLFLLFCLASVQEKPVSATCSRYVFLVLVKKDLFGDGVLVRAHELTLGLTCPITKELPDKFELQYLVTYCGIRKMDFETYTRFESSLYYRRQNRTVFRPSLEFPLTCIVHRRQFLIPHHSIIISTPPSNQKNVTKKTEYSASRPTYLGQASYYLLGKNLTKNPKPLEETREPSSMDSHGLPSLLPSVTDEESASTIEGGIIGFFFWIPHLGAEFFFPTLILSSICHGLFWYGNIGLAVSRAIFLA